MKKITTISFLIFTLSCVLVGNGIQDKIYDNSIQKVLLMWTPSVSIGDTIVKYINSADDSIVLFIFDITDDEIAKALLSAKLRGVSVNIIADKRQANGKYSLILFLISRRLNITLTHGRRGGLMHNKVLWIKNANDTSYFFIGSYNFTSGARNRNYESCLFLKLYKSPIEAQIKMMWNSLIKKSSIQNEK